MRPFPALAVAALAAILLAACGDDDEATTTTAASGPTGTLEATGIGLVEIGATEDDVTAAFGEPAGREEVDFGAGGPAPQENWTYPFPDGDVTLKFDTKTGELAAYDVYTAELETADGVKVGDPDSVLEQLYGDQLAGSPLGIHALVLSAEKPGTAESPALTFGIDGKTISAISGGQVIQPAGE